MHSNLDNFADLITARVKAPGADGTQKETLHVALLADCGSAFLQSAVREPIAAAAQLVEKITGSENAEHVQSINSAAKQQLGNVSAFAQHVSAAAGAAVPFAIAALAVRPLAKALVGETLFAGGLGAVGAARAAGLAETAAAAMISGSLFTPSQNQKTFWQDRLNNGLVNGLTMSTMHVLSHGLTDITGANAPGATVITKVINTSAAGAVAGAVGAEAGSMLKTGKSAAANDVLQASVDMAVTGGTLGAAGENFSRLIEARSSFPLIEEFATKKYNGLPKQDTATHYLGERARTNPADWLRYIKSEGIEGKDKALKLADWTAIERLKLLSDLERASVSPLVKAGVLENFVERMQAVGKSWSQDNLEKLTRDKLATERIYHLETANNTLKSATEKDPRKLEKLEADQERLDEVHDRYRDLWQAAVDKRTAALQATIADFLHEQNLPAATIKSDDFMRTAGSYALGRVKVADKYMTGAHMDDMTISIVFHELVHHEQHTLRIKNIADKLGIGRTATADEQARLLRMAYPKDELGATADGENKAEMAAAFVARVIVRRDGQRLNGAERSRAEMLSAARANYLSPYAQKAGKANARADNRWYLNNGLEKEAYPAGLLAFYMAQAKSGN